MKFGKKFMRVHMDNTKVNLAIRRFSLYFSGERLHILITAIVLGVFLSSCTGESSVSESLAKSPTADVVETLPAQTLGGETSKPTATSPSTSTPEPGPTPSPVPSVTMSVDDAERSPVGRAMRADVSSVEIDENGDWVAYDTSGNLIMRAKKTVEGEIGNDRWDLWMVEVNGANMTNVDGRIYVLNSKGNPSYTGTTLQEDWSISDAGGTATIQDADGLDIFTYDANLGWVEVVYYLEVVLPVSESQIWGSYLEESLELNDDPELKAEIKQRNNFGDGGLVDLRDHKDDPQILRFFEGVIPEDSDESGPVAVLNTFVRNIHYGDFTDLFEGVNVRALLELEYVNANGESEVIFVPAVYDSDDHLIAFETGNGPMIWVKDKVIDGEVWHEEFSDWFVARKMEKNDIFIPGNDIRITVQSKDKNHETGVFGRQGWEIEHDVLYEISSIDGLDVDAFMGDGSSGRIATNGVVVSAIPTHLFNDLR